MGIFSRLFGKDEKTDVEKYQQEVRQRREAQAAKSWHEHPSDEPEEASGTLLMIVEDVFFIMNRGTVVTGQAKAHFSVGERVWVQNADGSGRESTVASLEMFRRVLDTAHPGDNVGVLLGGVSKTDVDRGSKIQRL